MIEAAIEGRTELMVDWPAGVPILGRVAREVGSVQVAGSLDGLLMKRVELDPDPEVALGLSGHGSAPARALSCSAMWTAASACAGR